MKKSIILLTLLSSSLFSSVALASENSEKKFFAQINTGISLSNSTSVDVDLANYEVKASGNIPSYLLSVEGGMRLNENFRIGLSLENRKVPEIDFEDCDTSQDIGTLNASSLALMANVYYDFKNDSKWTPYLLAGLGSARNSVGVDSLNNGLYMPSNSTDNFAYKLGAGLEFAISESFNFDIRYQFADLGKYKFANTGTIYNVTSTATSTNLDYKTHDIMFGLGFKF